MTAIFRMANILRNFLSKDEEKMNKQEEDYLKFSDAFLSGKKEKTRLAYQESLRQFFSFAGVSLSKVSILHISRFRNHLQNKGLSKSTIYARLSALSSFFKYWIKSQEINSRSFTKFNPVEGIDRGKINPYSRLTKIGLENTKKILNQIDRSTLKGKRDYAIILFFIYTGRRRSEVVNLKWEDISQENGKIFYSYKGKGEKDGKREIPLPAWESLNDYLKASGRKLTDRSPLFTATNDRGKYLKAYYGKDGKEREEPLSGSAMAQDFKQYAKKTGLSGEKVKLHALRYLSVELRRRAGATVEEIQDFLDHSHLNTTQIYLCRMEGKEDNRWEVIRDILES